jgi:Anti-sigma-28 factor, FlgM
MRPRPGPPECHGGDAQPAREPLGGRADKLPRLRRAVRQGAYVVDERAVAEAMLRSGVFEALQLGDRAVRTEHDEPGAG